MIYDPLHDIAYKKTFLQLSGEDTIQKNLNSIINAIKSSFVHH